MPFRHPETQVYRYTSSMGRHDRDYKAFQADPSHMVLANTTHLSLTVPLEKTVPLLSDLRLGMSQQITIRAKDPYVTVRRMKCPSINSSNDVQVVRTLLSRDLSLSEA
jgi:hypothetical protein